MSYQVLARKYRPRSFAEMIGQEHVLKALIHALDHDRLHHAYLFTGTRGVGKTTVARVLAKSLNCEVGVSSSPCGVCSACVGISEGRFVDLIEVDAASRTKVEDTRELLDNVQYSPTAGRFKIYLIDEVHMLSKSSFNALLKTLEEPPAHVKFLLATTDPQKLPATILSRCLQFNLKNMSPEKVVTHLQSVLQKETVPFEESALWQLARAANGSMRDALSLTDQAISFGNGKLSERDVSAMLGSIDYQFIENILDALISADGAKLLGTVAEFSEHAPDYTAALSDLQTLLHRVAIAQALPEALDNSYGDREQIMRFAQAMAAEDVQLFYQTALMGTRDIGVSTVQRTAFEMVLLRMLAFKPQGLADIPTRALKQAAAPANVKEGGEPSAEASLPTNSVSDVVASSSTVPTSPSDISAPTPTPSPSADPLPQSSAPVSVNVSAVSIENSAQAEAQSLPVSELVGDASVDFGTPGSTHGLDPAPVSENTALQTQPSTPLAQDHSADSVASAVKLKVVDTPEPAPPAPKIQAKISYESFTPERWIELFAQLDLNGMLKHTASNLVCIEKAPSQLRFIQNKDTGGLLNKEHGVLLGEALSDYFACPLTTQIDIAAPDSKQIVDNETPRQQADRIRAEKKQKALEHFERDPIVTKLKDKLGAELIIDSIRLNEDE